VYRGTVAERKLYRADLAELAGIKTNSLNKLRKPEPDGYDIDEGHARPWWWESTATAWIEARPGRGWRRGQRSVT
jgi:hypothetical protein